MADSLVGEAGHQNLNLSAEERRVYGQLFQAADPDGFGAVSGDVAITFFEKTKLPSEVLGQIWQIADTENRGLLTPSGFSVVLRLIGHSQAGRVPTAELAAQPGPLPRFEGLSPVAPSIAAQHSGSPVSLAPSGQPPIRVPPLSPEKVKEYSSLFEKSGAENGVLPGHVAKQIFERARLPNEILGRIWNLADTRGRGAMDTTEFVMAMHLLASYKSGGMRGVPQSLPPGLYEAAAKRAPARTSTGPYPPAGLAPPAGIPVQLTGSSTGRSQSPIVRQRIGTALSTQSTGDGWAINLADKARFDQIFSGIDKFNRGYITGDQAVDFFGNARLPEEILAQIWDLADINSEGRLNRDEFAVAMYLIRQQRGTKEGRGNLPTTLPPALVPPMMRKQQPAPSQPTAPAFENAPITKPRSAADDLFGLDAFSSAPSQIPQSTGGSITDSPFQNPKSPLPPSTTSSPSPPAIFKPFVPSSSFGQSIVPPQTGLSSASHARSPQPSAPDDLLGDADPEVSQKLTSETSELANLSNQVGNLSKQMHEVQNTRASTQQDISQVGQQKKDFELRLSQLRAVYEKEVKDVTALQAQLTAQRHELKTLQQDFGMLEGGLQDLRNQRQQLAAALEQELHEKVALNEKIKVTNTEISELKPQVERLKSEARQQRGLVAISKKQLATLDVERDRLQDELDAAKVDLDAAKREAEGQARHVPQTTSAASPADLASPASSNLSTTNPFFRRGTGTSEGTFSPPVANRQQAVDRKNAFDSVFGPSFTAPTASTPPPVIFKNDVPSQSRQGEGARPEMTLPESPSQLSIDEGFPRREPPTPPTTSQISSAALPFRALLGRTDSVSSSVNVALPASRLSPADTPRAVLSASGSSTYSQDGESPAPAVHGFPTGDEKTASSPPLEHPAPIIGAAQTPTMSEQSSIKSSTQDIPGAFPQTVPPRSEISSTKAGASGMAIGGTAAVMVDHENEKNGETEKTPDDLGPNFDQYFGGPAHSRSPSEKAADFDSAFDKLKPRTTNGTIGTPNNEFPPIRELANDDSCDSSEAPTGFDDDFTPVSPARPTTQRESKQGSPEFASAVPASVQSLQARPPINTVPTSNSSLPEIEAQKPPPTYGESVPHDNPDHFPPEFKGLLPSRGDPTSSVNEPPHSVNHISGESADRGISHAYVPESAKPPHVAEAGLASSVTTSQQRNFTEDDFDAAFAEVTPAPVVDDEEDDFDPSITNNHAPEFDPTFDSPAPSKSPIGSVPVHAATTSHFSTTEPPTSTRNMNGTKEFHNFSANFSDLQPPAPSGLPAPTTTFKDSDWDEMFSSLDKPSNPSAPSAHPFAETMFSPPAGTPPNTAGLSRSVMETSPPSSSSPPHQPKIPDPMPERPALGRAPTAGTDHDDPILKRLMAMGWNREESLKALEEYDYNIDKALDYLTFKS